MYINLQAYLKINFKYYLLQEKKNLNKLKQFSNNLIINNVNKNITNIFIYTFIPFFFSDYNYIYNEKKSKKNFIKKNNFKFSLSQNINLFFIKNK
jgi:hypothetical protein